MTDCWKEPKMARLNYSEINWEKMMVCLSQKEPDSAVKMVHSRQMDCLRATNWVDRR
jgi:hypothetical protein